MIDEDTIEVAVRITDKASGKITRTTMLLTLAQVADLEASGAELGPEATAIVADWRRKS